MNRVAATLEDNAAARQFAAMLPLTVTLKDYAATEKVSDLPEKLDAEDAPEGYDPELGDIAYYAPWGNLAIFYRDFGYSRGLVRLGGIETGIEVLAQAPEGRVVIRLLGQ
ncbi:cyclophilin-like fold protein [Marinibaculum pumilum]|uniref:Cyclophilin-like fold protein n=1 Tax=Marinibaculum pumilum TaxID=1766165 RepID=A0ABV7L1N0_9PROT